MFRKEGDRLVFIARGNLLRGITGPYNIHKWLQNLSIIKILDSSFVSPEYLERTALSIIDIDIKSTVWN